MGKLSPMHVDRDRKRIWSVIQALRRFTLDDIEATAEVGRSNASKYVRALLRAGYLRVAVPRSNGVPGGLTVYQLVRDSGPHAPRIGNQVVHDPNTDPRYKPKMIMIPKSEYERALQCARACQGMLDPEAEVARLREIVRGVTS